MWNRLTEGLADIVAPEEGTGQEEQDNTDHLWSRFASVVAPLPVSPSSVGAAENDKDEPDLYICDLERALLQRKKQNEALETKIREFESREGELKRQVTEQEVEIAQQKADIQRLQAIRHDSGTWQTENGETPLGLNQEQLVQELHQSQAHIDAVAARCQAYEKELVSLRDEVEELQTANETLQKDKREIRSRLAEYEQGYVEMLAEMEQMKAVNGEEKATLMAKSEDHASSIDSQRLYDLEARLKTSEADKAVAQQDAKRLQRDLDALDGVLHQFQANNRAQKKHVAAVEAELERAKSELQTRQLLPEPNEEAIDDLERVMGKLAKKTHECEQLREALESTATQYNSERDVLDKRLAAQLVVAYVDSNKKGEVLQLMARIMGFTEDEKRRVGVGYPIQVNGGGGLFSSIIGLVAPGEGATTSVDPSTIEGKNFADLWSEYLLEEASKGQ
ncbi:unnamed protein product [Peronospora destructor]|uniref:GRIP domain-containing protein n=1 Tax=Peronospora destructor TaxID=86335 RepID=A0AAV0T2V4_9STRA|nr:unnamed protein product [Peronospora destructor]